MNKEKYICWKCGKTTTGSVRMDDGVTVVEYSLCKNCINDVKRVLR